MEFVDQAALALYMDHPLHQQFRKVFFPVREDPPVSMDFAELEDVD
ncbi:MAG: Dabb family protein [Chloroflexi bacterium]|nr:Dabb family protein [Chloroflexota bacterium]